MGGWHICFNFLTIQGLKSDLSTNYMSLFRLVIIYLQDSPESKMSCVKHNCASLGNTEEQITKTWVINETHRGETGLPSFAFTETIKNL